MHNPGLKKKASYEAFFVTPDTDVLVDSTSLIRVFTCGAIYSGKLILKQYVMRCFFFNGNSSGESLSAYRGDERTT
jgi:hypothetical protein